MARGIIERPGGPLSAPGAWFASEPRVTLRQLVDKQATAGAKLGLVVAWRMMGKPISPNRLNQVSEDSI